MTEEQIKKIIREELSNFIKGDRFIFEKPIQILDNRDIQLGRDNGTKIGTASDQLLGFYGKTPVNQPITISDASTQTLTGVDTISVAKTEADLTSCKNAINAIINRLQELGLIA